MTKASLLRVAKGRSQTAIPRTDPGTVVKRTDRFYIRYYKDDPDGGRTKVTERLCDLNTPPKKIELLQRSFISGINLSHREVLHLDSFQVRCDPAISSAVQSRTQKGEMKMKTKTVDYLAEELKKSEPVVDLLEEYLKREEAKQRTGLKAKAARACH